MSEAVKKETDVAVPTVTFTLDGQQVTVPKGTTVLEAAKQIGIHIPTFCWHPKLKSVGACRMCYVEVEKMPKLQVSCMLEAMNDMVVYSNSGQVKQGRKAIIEFILINHPLDCPTCDKGGECDLQNLTFEHGFDDSRFEFQKYRFVDEGMTSTFDDKKIGPEIVLNRNRCILCYKCVRSNKEAFGEYDLGAYERGNITEINAAPGRDVNNPYSGNLVEICPVGALTNSDWRYKIRVWLTKTTPSIDNFTSSGININFYKEDHQNKIFRVTSRENTAIDDGWIPDVTRYGYQIIGSPDRLQKPLIKKGGKQVEATWEEAINLIVQKCGDIKEKLGGVCVGGLIAPTLDNKSLYAFSRFIRKNFNSNNIDFRGDYRMLPDKPDTSFGVLRSQPFKIADIDDSDVIISFGSNIIHEHPNEYLRMRKAYNFNGAKIYTMMPYGIKAADISSLEMVYNPGTDETAINAICLAGIEQNLVDSNLANEYKQKVTPSSLSEAAKLCGVSEDYFRVVAKSLAEGKKITFLAGEVITRSKARDLISSAILNLNKLFNISGKGQIAILAFYANSKGAEKLGLLPEPTEKLKTVLKENFGSYPETTPRTTDSMMAYIKKEEIKAMFVFGANPVMLYPDRDFVKEAFEKLDFLVVSDLFESETAELADVVLPLAGWAEYDGDYVNLEGVNQSAKQAVKPTTTALPAYEIIRQIAAKMDDNSYTAENLNSEIAKCLALDSVLPLPNELFEIKPETEEVEGEYHLATYIIDDTHHSGHLTEKAPSLVNFAAEGYVVLSEELAAKNSIKDGESVRVESPVGKIILPVKINEFLDTDVILLPRNFQSSPVTSLLMRKKRIDRVKISKVDG
ncbi:MAG: NADH dehydrogenase (quinone) subunit G [Calditrichaeota bacterium]|nr:MAG: NADH dehydrogenase (quinone) subunit G [Calditrichota bacterium]